MMTNRGLQMIKRAVGLGLAIALAMGLAVLPGIGVAGSKDAPAKPYTPANLYRIETDHFVIYSDRSENETFKQVAAIEQFRYFMGERLPKSMRAESDVEPKLRLFLLDNEISLVVVRPFFFLQVDGVYIPCKEGESIFAAKGLFPVPVPKALGDQDQGQLTLFHEYTHHLMARRGLNHYPKWYVEGLADYYSTLQYDGAKVAVGVVPAGDNFVLNRVTWSHFENVLAPDDDMGGKNRGIISDPAVFYARAWLLTHYMMSDPVRHAQLDDYFARLEKGEPSITAFETATGIKASQLGGVLRAYSKAMPVSITTAADTPKMSGDVTLLEDSYEPFLLMSTVLDTCPGPKQGAWLLKTLKLQSDPAGLTAHGGKDVTPEYKARADWAVRMAPEVAANIDYKLAVAYAEILFGDAAKPREFLASIGATDEHYARAQYLLGRSYLTAAEAAKAADGAADFTQAYQMLERADASNPNDAPTQFYLAKSLMREDPAASGKTSAYAAQAFKLAPSVFDYAEFAAYLFVRKGERDTAVSLLSGFTNDPHDEDTNKRVIDGIAAIKAGKTADEVWAIVHKDPPPEDDEKDKTGKDAKKDKDSGKEKS